VALALAMPGTAAASADDVLAECFKTGGIQKDRYSNQELRDALKALAADGDAYSDCRDIINSLLSPAANAAGNGPPGDGEDADTPGGGANRAGDGGGANDSSGSVSDSGSGGSANGGSDSSEDSEKKRELARADTAQALGDRAFDPQNGAAIGSGDTSNGLPLPVVLALIALTLLLAAGAVLAIQQRNPAFMGALRRVRLPRRRR